MSLFSKSKNVLTFSKNVRFQVKVGPKFYYKSNARTHEEMRESSALKKVVSDRTFLKKLATIQVK